MANINVSSNASATTTIEITMPTPALDITDLTISASNVGVVSADTATVVPSTAAEAGSYVVQSVSPANADGGQTVTVSIDQTVTPTSGVDDVTVSSTKAGWNQTKRFTSEGGTV